MKRETMEFVTKAWTEIVLIIAGLSGTIAAWNYGKKQQNKRDDMDSITEGADRVIKMSDVLLQQIKADWDKDRAERHNCERRMIEFEMEMAEMKRQNKILSDKVDRLSKKN
jgi:hypothetical protein